MSIQTRNKRKDWQPGPEQKAHKVVCLRPLSGHLETTKWALRDQASGIDRPWNGHSLPILRALSAQSFRRFLGTSCGSATSLLCIMLYDDFVMLLGCFCDNFMPISWYFYQFYDTLMILLVKELKKHHSCILLHIRLLYRNPHKKMILWYFFHKKLFSCAHKLDGKSKKYLIWNLIDTLKITSRRRLYHMAT